MCVHDRMWVQVSVCVRTQQDIRSLPTLSSTSHTHKPNKKFSNLSHLNRVVKEEPGKAAHCDQHLVRMTLIFV